MAIVRQRGGPRPLDGDRPGAGADVPEQLAGTGREAGQGRGAEVPLGQLAVVLERVVGQPGSGRGRSTAAIARAVDADQVQRRRRASNPSTAVASAPALRGRCRGRRARSARSARSRRRPAARPARPGVSASEDSTISRRPGARWRRTRSRSRPTTVTTSDGLADQPIRARASATEETAGWIRTAVRAQQVEQGGADAGDQRVAAGQHHSPAARRSPAEPGRAGRSGLGQVSRSVGPRRRAPDRACRRPPIRTSAAAINARAGARPARDQPRPASPTTSDAASRGAPLRRPPDLRPADEQPTCGMIGHGDRRGIQGGSGAVPPL